MMILKEKLTRTEVVSAKYKGRGFETIPVPNASYGMDMPCPTCATSIEVERHVFATKNGDINVKLENAPSDLQKGQDYSLEIKKIKMLGITTSKIVL
jgi:hypothetical protein